ncbi:MAG: coatomer subunit beta-1-like [Trebouxia sp. A1-2]|nr:MAG: coatomer subunit beta-1-like [Trebouxia sp. A1-2]
MAQSVERSCTMLVHFDKPSSGNEIKEALEGNDGPAKVEALQKAIMMLLNGEQLPALFITIVRYVLPSEDHTVQKLLLLYLETIEKTDSSGKILPEMILICQNLRNNLQHPNEYIRGVTLRFLCRIREEEIFEPLIPSILTCLEHRHSYVRRNAVLAINCIYKLPKGEQHLQDAPDLIEKVLNSEQDLSTKRNAFLMLCNHAQDRAVHYLLSQIDNVAHWGDILQMAVLELIRKVCRVNPGEKGKYIKIILSLLQSTSSAVVYECAVTLVSLSQAPTAIRAAANCYCQLLVSQSDNNVKLIVLDRLQELKAKHREVMQDVLMDVLRALTSPNMDIRKKTLDIALDLITSRNIDEVVMVLKKEVMKTQNKELDKGPEYRQLLVQAIHSCAVKFPDRDPSADGFPGDTNTASALDVVFFVREIMETNSKLRASILERCWGSYNQIRVCSCTLWILGEYCDQKDDIYAALETIKSALGPLPFFHDEDEAEKGKDDKGKASTKGDIDAETPIPVQQASHRPAVLADGSYASQTAITDTITTSSLSSTAPNIRALLLTGDYFLGGVVAGALTKLLLRLRKSTNADEMEVNKLTAEAMLYIVSILRLGESQASLHPRDDDAVDRMVTCLKVLTHSDNEAAKVWLEDCRHSFAQMIHDKLTRDAEEAKTKDSQSQAQPDELIDFHHLKARRGMSQIEIEDQVQTDLQRATGLTETGSENAARLNRVLQLTGFSDPVYAEAYVTVHQYDIVLDVTVINRTAETLQNLCLELATMGPTSRSHQQKLVPSSATLFMSPQPTPTAVWWCSTTSTLTSWTTSAPPVPRRGSEEHVGQSREKRVAINTTITDVSEFLDHIVASTNMRCATPRSALEGECGFLAANLYAKSVFGEDALVNVSVEKQPDGKLAGYIRIRSKTQGIALSLGDKLILKQKG